LDYLPKRKPLILDIPENPILAMMSQRTSPRDF